MAKDHYVARTYLKHFSIPNKPGHVLVINKSFPAVTPRPRPVSSICYKIDWSSNPHFKANPRVIEDFLKPIEDTWDKNIRMLLDPVFEENVRFKIAGYIAYLRACTPTSTRLASDAYYDLLKLRYDQIEEREYQNPNSQFKKAIEVIRKAGGTQYRIDGDFIKANAIVNISQYQLLFFRSPWIIFENKTEIPFLTSDNPIVPIYRNVQSCEFYFPVTPSLAIVIHPEKDFNGEVEDAIMGIKPEGVEEMNEAIVKGAEEKVIFNQDHKFSELVQKYQNWRHELIPSLLGNEEEMLLINRQKLVDTAQPEEKKTLPK